MSRLKQTNIDRPVQFFIAKFDCIKGAKVCHKKKKIIKYQTYTKNTFFHQLSLQKYVNMCQLKRDE
jgi:hypothetical protein